MGLKRKEAPGKEGLLQKRSERASVLTADDKTLREILTGAPVLPLAVRRLALMRGPIRASVASVTRGGGSVKDCATETTSWDKVGRRSGRGTGGPP
jgi:hypothetical protein